MTTLTARAWEAAPWIAPQENTMPWMGAPYSGADQSWLGTNQGAPLIDLWGTMPEASGFPNQRSDPTWATSDPFAGNWDFSQNYEGAQARPRNRAAIRDVQVYAPPDVLGFLNPGLDLSQLRQTFADSLGDLTGSEYSVDAIRGQLPGIAGAGGMMDVLGEAGMNTRFPGWQGIDRLSGIQGVDITQPDWGVRNWRPWTRASSALGPGILQGLSLMAPFLSMGFAAPGMAALEGAAAAGLPASSLAAAPTFSQQIAQYTGLPQGVVDAGVRAGGSLIRSGGNPRSLLSPGNLLGAASSMFGGGSDGGMALGPGDIGNDPSLGLDNAGFMNVSGGGDMFEDFDFFGGNSGYEEFFNNPNANEYFGAADFSGGNVGYGDTSWGSQPAFNFFGGNEGYNQFFNDPMANEYTGTRGGGMVGYGGTDWGSTPMNLGGGNWWDDLQSGAKTAMGVLQSPLGRMGGSLAAALMGRNSSQARQWAMRQMANTPSLPGAPGRYQGFMNNPSGAGATLLAMADETKAREAAAGRVPGAARSTDPAAMQARDRAVLDQYMGLSQMYANQAQPNSAQLTAALAAAGMEGETGNILAAALGNLTSGQQMGDPNVLAELGRMILAMAEEKQQNQRQLGA